MEAAALIVPTIASFALGGALLLPIRDNRKGRKATISGRTPLTLHFGENADGSFGEMEATAIAPDTAKRTGADSHEVKGAEPFAAIRTFLENLRANHYAPSGEIGQPIALEESDVVVERSFAEELAALLPTGDRNGNDESIAVLSPIAFAETPADRESQAQVHVEPDDRVTRPQVVLTGISFADRIVPLTRLPLRHAPRTITWPATATPALVLADDPARYAFLRSAAQSKSRDGDALLARAFREETPTGRALALAALSRTPASRISIDTFVVALASGSDEERAIAVDGLAEAGAREELSAALSDRVDAIAARAALAYVGTTVRADYRSALEPFADAARIEAILEILAGFIE